MFECFEEFSITPREGVYILFSRGVVVYVGQTRNIHARILVNHRNDRKGFSLVGLFDRAMCIDVAGSTNRLAYERALIRALRPALNIRVSPRGPRDSEILASLGIPDYSDDDLATWIADLKVNAQATRRKPNFVVRKRHSKTVTASTPNVIAKRCPDDGHAWAEVVS